VHLIRAAGEPAFAPAQDLRHAHASRLSAPLPQVGITSGDGCDGTWFVKLSEPTTLAQVRACAAHSWCWLLRTVDCAGTCPQRSWVCNVRVAHLCLLARPSPQQIVVWLESRIPTNNSGLSDANLAWITTAKEYIFNATAGEIEL